MAKSVGTKILQYDLNNILINNFVSFADASRQTGIPNSTIKKCVKDNITNRGFIWQKEIILHLFSFITPIIYNKT